MRPRRLVALSLVVNALLLAGAGVWLVRRLRHQPTDSGRLYAEARRSQLEALGAEGATMEVFLGDSVTDFGEWSELLGRPVANRGIAGDTTEDVLARLPAVLAVRPRQVYLMIGINDLLRGDPVDQVAARHADIVARLRAGGIDRVVVQALLPINPGLARVSLDNPTIAAFNAKLPGAVDVATGLRNPAGELDARFTLDGLHLNGPGYRAWADALLALPRTDASHILIR